MTGNTIAFLIFVLGDVVTPIPDGGAGRRLEDFPPACHHAD